MDRALAAIARNSGVDWQATNMSDRVVITRASQSFDATAISDAIMKKLEEQYQVDDPCRKLEQELREIKEENERLLKTIRNRLLPVS